MTLVWLYGLAVLPARAAFSSLYIFGDGVCTTTNNVSGLSYYWGNRFCNGRVWVEVLAQRLGLPGNTTTNVNWSYSSKNWSYLGNTSSNLVTEVSQFSASDAGTSLFVVWVCDADFVGDMQGIYSQGTPQGTNLTTWNNYIIQSITNQWKAITNLYAKGARTVIMPNAVDITEVPQYSGESSPDKTFIRGRVSYFNTSFTSMLNQAKATRPDLTIYIPDFFTLLNNMVAQPTSYGLLYPPPNYDAVDDGYTSISNGVGVTYIFWDDLDPSAKAQEIMADTVQPMISPVSISQLTSLVGSNRLDAVNMPIGLGGSVYGRTNLVLGSWTSVTNFSSTSATQTIYVRTSVPQQFYQLKFPFAWSWP